MNNHKASKRWVASLILSSSFLLFLVSHFRVSASGVKIGVGSPAYAQRGRMMGRAVLAVLGWVASTVIANSAEAAVAEILDDDQYIGSYYSATFYSSQHGRNITWHFFQDSHRAWYGYFPSNNTWRPVSMPSVTVSRTADVYQKSSGEFFWTSP